MSDWKIFKGSGAQHDRITTLPPPPPWRFARAAKPILPTRKRDRTEEGRAAPFLPSREMIRAVNAALYLRRPLLLTGKPGSGKSTLISKVAHELNLGPVLRWPIGSRSTVKAGIYQYDAVGRLQAGKDADPPVEDYLTLGPLGTALMAEGRPRPLLVDEIDKSDLDFANDLLNVIEEGEYEIPELRRLKADAVEVRDAFGALARVEHGLLRADHFPFVVMTSNAEREFPAPFLRRCVRLDVPTPDRGELVRIIDAQLARFAAEIDRAEVDAVIEEFFENAAQGDVSTDQLLNAVFLTVALKDHDARRFTDDDISALRGTLLRTIGGSG